MKGFRIICMMAVIFLIASAVRADPIVDPRMRIAYASMSDPVDMYFWFTSNQNGGGFFEFYNDSGVDWTSLLIEAPTPTDQYGNPILDEYGQYTIVDDDFIFMNHDLLVTESLFSVLFSGVDFEGFGGIPDTVHFTISLNDVDPEEFPEYGSGGWLRNDQPITFNATANATAHSASVVPEPGSALLLLGGIFLLGVYFVLRKRRSRTLGQNRR